MRGYVQTQTLALASRFAPIARDSTHYAGRRVPLTERRRADAHFAMTSRPRHRLETASPIWFNHLTATGHRARDAVIPTPYGSRPLVYCDHTASGRGLASIENVMSRDVLPHYANTHSEASHTGRHTGQLREWARQTIKEVINAGPDDVVIFCGSGATAAVNTLVHLLGLRSASGRRRTNPAGVVRWSWWGPTSITPTNCPGARRLADVIRLPLDPEWRYRSSGAGRHARPKRITAPLSWAVFLPPLMSRASCPMCQVSHDDSKTRVPSPCGITQQAPRTFPST